MTNAELADRAMGIADDRGCTELERRGALCARIALLETRNVASARKVLADWDGPEDIRDQAINLLSTLTGSTEGTV